VVLGVPQIARRGHADCRIRFAFSGIPARGLLFAGYVVAQYPEVRLDSGMRVFVMEHGDTRWRISSLSRFPEVPVFPAAFRRRRIRRIYGSRTRAISGGRTTDGHGGGWKFSVGAITSFAAFPVAADVSSAAEAGVERAAGDLRLPGGNGRIFGRRLSMRVQRGCLQAREFSA